MTFTDSLRSKAKIAVAAFGVTAGTQACVPCNPQTRGCETTLLTSVQAAPPPAPPEPHVVRTETSVEHSRVCEDDNDDDSCIDITVMSRTRFYQSSETYRGPAR